MTLITMIKSKNAKQELGARKFLAAFYSYLFVINEQIRLSKMYTNLKIRKEKFQLCNCIKLQIYLLLNSKSLMPYERSGRGGIRAMRRSACSRDPTCNISLFSGIPFDKSIMQTMKRFISVSPSIDTLSSLLQFEFSDRESSTNSFVHPSKLLANSARLCLSRHLQNK